MFKGKMSFFFFSPIKNLIILPLHSPGSTPLHFILSYFNPTKRRSIVHRFYQCEDEGEELNAKKPVLLHSLVDVLERTEVRSLVQSKEGFKALSDKSYTVK
jgi:hypothetical protein